MQHLKRNLWETNPTLTCITLLAKRAHLERFICSDNFRYLPETCGTDPDLTSLIWTQSNTNYVKYFQSFQTHTFRLYSQRFSSSVGNPAEGCDQMPEIQMWNTTCHCVTCESTDWKTMGDTETSLSYQSSTLNVIYFLSSEKITFVRAWRE